MSEMTPPNQSNSKLLDDGFSFLISKPKTVGDLREAIRNLDDSVQLCLRNGPLPNLHVSKLYGDFFLEFK